MSLHGAAFGSDKWSPRAVKRKKASVRKKEILVEP